MANDKDIEIKGKVEMQTNIPDVRQEVERLQQEVLKITETLRYFNKETERIGELAGSRLQEFQKLTGRLTSLKTQLYEAQWKAAGGTIKKGQDTTTPLMTSSTQKQVISSNNRNIPRYADMYGDSEEAKRIRNISVPYGKKGRNISILEAFNDIIKKAQSGREQSGQDATITEKEKQDIFESLYYDKQSKDALKSLPTGTSISKRVFYDKGKMVRSKEGPKITMNGYNTFADKNGRILYSSYRNKDGELIPSQTLKVQNEKLNNSWNIADLGNLNGKSLYQLSEAYQALEEYGNKVWEELKKSNPDAKFPQEVGKLQSDIQEAVIESINNTKEQYLRDLAFKKIGATKFDFGQEGNKELEYANQSALFGAVRAKIGMQSPSDFERGLETESQTGRLISTEYSPASHMQKQYETAEKDARKVARDSASVDSAIRTQAQAMTDYYSSPEYANEVLRVAKEEGSGAVREYVKIMLDSLKATINPSADGATLKEITTDFGPSKEGSSVVSNGDMPSYDDYGDGSISYGFSDKEAQDFEEKVKGENLAEQIADFYHSSLITIRDQFQQLYDSVDEETQKILEPTIKMLQNRVNKEVGGQDIGYNEESAKIAANSMSNFVTKGNVVIGAIRNYAQDTGLPFDQKLVKQNLDGLDNEEKEKITSSLKTYEVLKDFLSKIFSDFQTSLDGIDLGQTSDFSGFQAQLNTLDEQGLFVGLNNLLKIRNEIEGSIVQDKNTMQLALNSGDTGAVESVTDIQKSIDEKTKFLSAFDSMFSNLTNGFQSITNRANNPELEGTLKIIQKFSKDWEIYSDFISKFYSETMVIGGNSINQYAGDTVDRKDDTKVTDTSKLPVYKNSVSREESTPKGRFLANTKMLSVISNYGATNIDDAITHADARVSKLIDEIRTLDPERTQEEANQLEEEIKNAEAELERIRKKYYTKVTKSGETIEWKKTLNDSDFQVGTGEDYSEKAVSMDRRSYAKNKGEISRKRDRLLEIRADLEDDAISQKRNELRRVYEDLSYMRQVVNGQVDDIVSSGENIAQIKEQVIKELVSNDSGVKEAQANFDESFSKVRELQSLKDEMELQNASDKKRGVKSTYSEDEISAYDSAIADAKQKANEANIRLEEAKKIALESASEQADAIIEQRKKESELLKAETKNIEEEEKQEELEAKEQAQEEIKEKAKEKIEEVKEEIKNEIDSSGKETKQQIEENRQEPTEIVEQYSYQKDKDNVVETSGSFQNNPPSPPSPPSPPDDGTPFIQDNNNGPIININSAQINVKDGVTYPNGTIEINDGVVQVNVQGGSVDVNGQSTVTNQNDDDIGVISEDNPYGDWTYYPNNQDWRIPGSGTNYVGSTAEEMRQNVKQANIGEWDIQQENKAVAEYLSIQKEINKVLQEDARIQNLINLNQDKINQLKSSSKDEDKALASYLEKQNQELSTQREQLNKNLAKLTEIREKNKVGTALDGNGPVTINKNNLDRIIEAERENANALVVAESNIDNSAELSYQKELEKFQSEYNKNQEQEFKKKNSLIEDYISLYEQLLKAEDEEYRLKEKDNRTQKEEALLKVATKTRKELEAQVDLQKSQISSGNLGGFSLTDEDQNKIVEAEKEKNSEQADRRSVIQGANLDSLESDYNKYQKEKNKAIDSYISQYEKVKAIEAEEYDLQQKMSTLSGDKLNEAEKDLAIVQKRKGEEEELLSVLKQEMDSFTLDNEDYAKIDKKERSADIDLSQQKDSSDAKARTQTNKNNEESLKKQNSLVDQYISNYKKVTNLEDQEYELKRKSAILEGDKKAENDSQLALVQKDLAIAREKLKVLNEQANIIDDTYISPEVMQRLQNERGQVQERQVINRRDIDTRIQSMSNASDKKAEDKQVKEYESAYKKQLQYERDIARLRKNMEGQSGVQLKDSERQVEALQNQLTAISSITSGYDRQNGTLNGIKLSTEAIAQLNQFIDDAQMAQATALTQINTQYNRQQGLLASILGGFRNAFRNITDASLAYTIINKVKGVINEVITATKELDAALVDIQIATGQTREQTRKLLVEYADLADELGRTTQSVATASNDWLRAGYQGKEAAELTRASMMLSTLGMIDASDATTYLISTLKGWKIQADEVIDVVDKLTVTICGVCLATSIGHGFKCR